MDEVDMLLANYAAEARQLFQIAHDAFAPNSKIDHLTARRLQCLSLLRDKRSHLAGMAIERSEN